MASIVDSFNEALSENLSYVKIVLYSVPVFFVAKLFMVGKMAQFYFWASILGVLFIALLTQGINNVRLSKTDILVLNPIKLGWTIVKSAAVIVPWGVVCGLIGKFLCSFDIPFQLPHISLIYCTIIWIIIFSVFLTAYLSFAKYMRISQGYNIKVIFDSCIDVFVSFLFFIPQLLIANFVLLGPVWYLFSAFHVPMNHWAFVAYCSAVFVINISIMANYFAQIAYEQIKGNNEEYDDNLQISLLDDASERLNGK